jgi:hypothetical protein
MVIGIGVGPNAFAFDHIVIAPRPVAGRAYSTHISILANHCSIYVMLWYVMVWYDRIDMGKRHS